MRKPRGENLSLANFFTIRDTWGGVNSQTTKESTSQTVSKAETFAVQLDNDYTNRDPIATHSNTSLCTNNINTDIA